MSHRLFRVRYCSLFTVGAHVERFGNNVKHDNIAIRKGFKFLLMVGMEVSIVSAILRILIYFNCLFSLLGEGRQE